MAARNTGEKMLKQNILIVDDSEISREILIDMLTDEYHLYEAENGLDAVELLKKKPDFFQLVLLDLQMPQMDGYEVLRLMQQKDWLKKTPVIIISSEIGEASKLGAMDFLPKPFIREIVCTRIRNVLAINERYMIDSLTGGLNRKGFIQKTENFFLENVKKTDYEILYFNIKNFKAVNELIGIENGDLVLKQFYQNLLHAEFQPLLIARIESDQFACLAKRQGDTYEYMEKLCHQKFEQKGKSFHMYIHCGVFHVQEKPMSVSGMIDRAKIAEAYQSDEYKKSYMVYASSIKAEYIDQAELSSELSKSIENGEFQVYYQPIMDTATGKIASAEALVRWIHPEKGMISPAVFIPALEKDGNISKLDMYVLQMVRKFQKEQYRAGTPIVPVSVNLSGIDFYDEEMMDQVMEFISCQDIPDWTIRFEITETSYAAMGGRCLERIEALRKHNIKILMDDFGTGYSSLGLLHECEIDILKIDMSFIRQTEKNPKARSILRAIIDMGHMLDLHLVAEGVETEEQLEFLKSCGCDYVQGYYFSRPLPCEAFAQMLKKTLTET